MVDVKNKWDKFDADDKIIHVLTSNRSYDAFEMLYSKANKTVKGIANYKRYFKPIGPASCFIKGMG